MTEKIAGTIAVVAVALVGGYFIYQGLFGPDELKDTETPIPGVSTIAWAFDPAGTDEGDAPLTSVSVIAGGKTYTAGTYQGTCSSIEDSNWELLPGETSGAICWWAGSGTELGVFEENGELVVKRGVLSEGTAEEKGTRGTFSPLLVLKANESVLLKTKLNVGASGLGFMITPLEVLEDSRCPADVQCIQAGTVRVRAAVEAGPDSSEGIFTLGIVETRENVTLTLVGVEPAPTAGKDIASSSYTFTFGVERREQ